MTSDGLAEVLAPVNVGRAGCENGCLHPGLVAQTGFGTELVERVLVVLDPRGALLVVIGLAVQNNRLRGGRGRMDPAWSGSGWPMAMPKVT